MAEQFRIQESEVTVTSGDETLQAFFALPDRSGPVPGAVMIHDIFGLRDLARQQARRLASKGIAAVYPHLLRGTGPFDPSIDPEAGKSSQPYVKSITIDRCMADILAGLDWLRSRKEVDKERLITWGYCWGGAMALRGADRIPGLSATVVWHGMLKDEELEEMDRAKGPILGLFGGADEMISPEDVRALQERCAAAGVETDFHIIPDAPHSFCDHTRPQSFRRDACEHAWGEVDRFIRERLI